jgi:DNA-binding CsgD family transcriptional regulator
MGSHLWSDALHVVSFSAYLGLLLFLVDGAEQVSSLSGKQAALPYLFAAALLSAMICGLVLALRGALSATAVFHHLGIKTGVLVLLGFALSLAASHLHLPLIFNVFGCVSLGVGFAMLGIVKCLLLSTLQEYQLLRMLAVMGVLASLVKMLLLFLPTGQLNVALILLLLLSAHLPAQIAVETSGEGSSGGSAPTPPSSATSKDLTVLEMTKGMIERNWVLFAGLAISIMLGIVSWRGSITGESATILPEPGGQLGDASGALLSSLLLLGLFRRPSPDSKDSNRVLNRLQNLTPIIPLICIASMLVAWIMGVWEEGPALFGGYTATAGKLFSSIPIGFSTMTLFILLIKRLVSEVRSGLSAVFVFGLFIALVAAFFLFYTALQLFLPLRLSRIIDLLLKLLYLVIAAAYMLMFAQHRTGKSTPPVTGQIQKVARTFSLTKRETEILMLMAQGRSAPHIAETEFISLNTVKTHIKRLYTKTGVHNREELLDIVYRTEEVD